MLLVKNRKAYHDYSVLRTLECGVVLEVVKLNH